MAIIVALGHEHGRRGISLCVVLLLCFGPNALGQLDEEKAEALARQTVQSLLGRTPGSFLQIDRDISLEEKFRTFGTAVNDLPYIFRATTTGEVKDGSAVTEHFSVHGPLTFIIAVTHSEKVFVINNSNEQFQQFAKERGIKLSSPESVKAYLVFYWLVNPRNFNTTLVTSAAQVRELVEAQLTRSIGEQAGKREFGEWWIRYGSKVSECDYTIRIKKSGGQFTTSSLVLTNVVPEEGAGTPRVLEGRVKIGSKGDFGRVRFRSLKVQNSVLNKQCRVSE
jgi:hypothetical protein